MNPDRHTIFSKLNTIWGKRPSDGILPNDPVRQTGVCLMRASYPKPGEKANFREL